MNFCIDKMRRNENYSSAMKMYAKIKFDREIDVEKHYISLGGYEMTFVDDHGLNPKTSGFDFFTFTGTIDEEDPTVLHCDMYELDVDTFPRASFLEHFSGNITKINEFYIYTGEDDDPEINPVELLSLRLVNADNNDIYVYDGILGKVFD